MAHHPTDGGEPFRVRNAKKFCISIKVYYIVGAKVPYSDSLQRYRATKGKPYTSHKTTKAKFHRPPLRPDCIRKRH